MPYARFVEMIEEFKTLPPRHEALRAGILLPGDKGYPTNKINQQDARRAVQRSIQSAGKEPEWMRQRRLKEERKRAGGFNG